MEEVLYKIASAIQKAEPTASCFIDTEGCQIIVSFSKRPGVEVALLTPAAQAQVKGGRIDEADFSEMLFSIRRIANTTF